MAEGAGVFRGQSPDEIFHRLVEMGDAWAEANATAQFYEQLTKSLLAQLTTRRMGNIEKVSVAAAERDALGSDEYQKHIKQGVNARREADRMKVRYVSAQVWVDLWRSANANKRAEMQLGGLVT